MYGFDDTHVILSKKQYTLWRRPLVVGLELRGVLSDAVSDAWRADVADEFARGGYPRFYAMDARSVEPESTMAARYRTAVFVKESLQKLEWAVVHIASAKSLVVVRTVLRVVGLGNCSLVEAESDFHAAIDEMRNGRRPALAPAVTGSLRT